MPVSLNPIEIEQVLVNLICNAFESEDEGVIVELSLYASTR